MESPFPIARDGEQSVDDSSAYDNVAFKTEQTLTTHSLPHTNINQSKQTTHPTQNLPQQSDMRNTQSKNVKYNGNTKDVSSNGGGNALRSTFQGNGKTQQVNDDSTKGAAIPVDGAVDVTDVSLFLLFFKQTSYAFLRAH